MTSFSSSPQSLRITFAVSQIRCSACAWKIESYLKKHGQYSSWFIDIVGSKLTVNLHQWTDANILVEDLRKMGFSAIPLVHDESAEELKKAQYEMELLRIAVAGFCFGNIMTLATSNYLGASENFRHTFDIISFVLILPTLLFSAYPFYKGFWGTLKTGTPNLDFPIALALFFGTALSAVSLFSGGKQHVYFDSVAGLIFFLLVSRFVLNRLMDRLVRSGQLSLPGIELAHRIENGQEQLIPAALIKTQDRLRIHSGETVPCDGFLMSDSALVNTAVVTGEPFAHTIERNGELLAGSIVTGPAIDMVAISTVKNSRMGRLISEVTANDFRKLPYAHTVDRWAMWFSYGVLALGVGIFIYWWPIDPNIGLNRVLALFMTSCPCALTFGFPLILNIIIQKAHNKNIIVQDVNALSKLSEVQEIYFDKTGTLTSSELILLTDLNQVFLQPDLLAIAALEEKSHHPIAQVLKESIAADKTLLPAVSDFMYEPTRGIRGTVNGHNYALLSHNNMQSKLSIQVFKDNQLLGAIDFDEKLRMHCQDVITQLQNSGLNVHILSGDSQENVTSVAKSLHINGTAQGRLSPEEKQKIIKNQKHCAMIGDGINDAGALSSAEVGIAMPGPVEKLHNVASLILSKPTLSSLPLAFSLGRFAKRATIRLALLSFSYNLIISTLAIMGWIHPLVAAILMPASSLVVIGLVQFTRKEMEWKLSSF
ncbi:MAG: HAD-IC family P-type ATPase [Bdellovibrionaceae bacterium]|nr:HAD-IC family P-type ATPase [Pseudobdellovibrionaceae bacterium]